MNTKRMRKEKENIFDVVQVIVQDKYSADFNDLSLLKVR
jgi:hypothetical protein